MGYDAISSGEIGQDKPVDVPLMTKIKDNFDYLYGQAGNAPSLVQNGSFETYTGADGIPDNWSRTLYSGGSAAFEESSPAHGAKAYSFVHPGGAGNGGGYLESGYVEVTSLKEMVLLYIVWATAAGMKNQIYVRYYDKDKSYLSESALYNSTSNPTSATFYVSTFTPPASARYIKLRLIGGYTDTDVAGTAYFDGLWLMYSIKKEMIDGGLSVGESDLGAASVSQAKLKTSTGTVSLDCDMNSCSTNTDYYSVQTLPGGEYGFVPRGRAVYGSGSGDGGSFRIGNCHSGQCISSSSYVCSVELSLKTNSAGFPYHHYFYANQRYVTSSGEIYWIYLLRDKETGAITATWLSPDHPCLGNGGKPLLVPHPFADYDPDKHEIIILTPDADIVSGIWEKQDVDGDGTPDIDFIEALWNEHEVDWDSTPEWPTTPVTVKLLGDRDWKQAREEEEVTVLQAPIPKPLYAIHKSLKAKV